MRSPWRRRARATIRRPRRRRPRAGEERGRARRPRTPCRRRPRAATSAAACRCRRSRVRTLLRMSTTARSPAGDRRAADAEAWQERLVELMTRHRVPGATLGILEDGSLTSTGAGGPQQGDRRRGHARLAVPDRLDHEGLDGHARHAAGGRGAARPRRARGGGPPGVPRGRPRRDELGDHPPPPDAHERHRRGRVHGHGPRRRLPRALRRWHGGGRPESPARRHVVVLQLGLHPRRADRGAPHRTTWDGAPGRIVEPLG